MAISANKIFQDAYKTEPEMEFFSPGRVNLIGEYTDIAGGHVLPMAIQLGISASLKMRDDRIVSVTSQGETASFSLDNLVKSETKWINYIIGVFYVFASQGIKVEKGFNAALNSDLPTASGLSSSASLEVLFGTIIREITLNKKITDWDIVKNAKACENNFIGLNSGIMDQFACEFGRKGMCMLLDTKTLEFNYAPFDIGSNDLVIMNSNKQRGLTESKYNTRVAEMKEGLADLKPYLKFDDCCSIRYEDFLKYQSKIKNPLAAKRIKHLISDNKRVLESSELLKEGKIDDFCRILNEGHLSMKDDFESSGFELDTLCELALANGAKGARMTGAGFAGCAIFISDKKKTKKVIAGVIKGYKEKTGRDGECYLAIPSDGARRIK